MKKAEPFQPRIKAGDMTTRWYVVWYDQAGKPHKEYGRVNEHKTHEARMLACEALRDELLTRFAGEKPEKAKKAKTLPLLPVLRRFLLRKAATTRPSTMQTYNSKFRTFEQWAIAQKLADTDVRHFTDAQARAFMRHVADRSATTYNHYHDILKSLFAAAIDEGLIQINPFAKHDRRRPTPEPALYFPDELRDTLAERLRNLDPQLYVFTQFVYHCFIRPEELRKLQVQDVRLSERRIWVDGKISKNKVGAYVVISDAMAALVEWAGLLAGQPGDYLFTAKGTPGPAPVGKNYMKIRHRRHLLALGMNADRYMLYSWKHTGAVAAVRRGVNIMDLMGQLRHHDLKETHGYLRQMNVEVSDSLIKGW